MNFADILEQWEHTQKNGRKNAPDKPKRTGTTTAECADKTKRVHPMDLWLRRYGVFDKDAELERNTEKRRFSNEVSAKKMPTEAELDLHGLTRDEAWLRIDTFIGECVRRKLKKVLIIHGKGNHSAEEPILKDTVRAFIEKDKRLGASGHPSGADGGQGATWVIIRESLLQH